MQENSKLRAIKRAIFREPRRGAFFWIALLFGCALLVLNLFFPTGSELLRLTNIGTAAMILLLGASEVLSRNRTMLAGLLRMGGVAAIALLWLVGILRLVA
jgi:hypothetical protein